MPDAAEPDTRSPGRYLLRLGRLQWRTLVVGMACGIVWMLAIALFPWAVGRSVDAIARHDGADLLRWALVLLGLGTVSALFGAARHAMAVRNWLTASFRSAATVHARALRAGPALTRSLPLGEVAAVFTSDVWRLGNLYDVTARFAGAVVSYVVVGVILLRTNTRMGLLVLLGGPLLLGTLALIIRPLQRRQAAQREESGRLTTLGADTVAGLRVLRGIGGEDAFLTRYAEQSHRVRAAGWRAASLQAALDSSQVLLPGLFVVLVTWTGSHEVLAGRMSTGQLVSSYGYAAFLTMPFWTVIEFLDRSIRARISAAKALKVLRVEPDHADPVGGTTPARMPSPSGDLYDPVSDVTARGGRLTALVSAVPEDSSAVIDRFGRLTPEETSATWDGVPVASLPLTWVRARIVVSESDPRLFTGVLREQLLAGHARDDDAILSAIGIASAADALDAVPDGLDGRVEERGRSFSGGQRQRLALVRALLLDPPALLLIEPTSSVDAHTEARIAARLADARRGRTTVVASASPLLLDRCDEVVLIEDGVAAASGPHAELLASSRAYRAVVTRGEVD